MEQRTYTPEDQNRITNNFNKVVTKAQNNEHSLDDMKAIIEYQQMKRIIEGKSYWVANPVKEKPPAKVKVTCGICNEVKSKCPYKAKDRKEGCLVLEAKKAKDLESMVVPVARTGKKTQNFLDPTFLDKLLFLYSGEFSPAGIMRVVEATKAKMTAEVLTSLELDFVKSHWFYQEYVTYLSKGDNWGGFKASLREQYIKFLDIDFKVRNNIPLAMGEDKVYDSFINDSIMEYGETALLAIKQSIQEVVEKINFNKVEPEVSDTEKLAKAMFKRMKGEALSEEEQIILQNYEEKTHGGI